MKENKPEKDFDRWNTKRLIRKIGVLDEKTFNGLKTALKRALFGDK